MPFSSKKLVVLSVALLLSACNEEPAKATANTPAPVNAPTVSETTPSVMSQKQTLDDPNIVVIVNDTPVTKSMYAAFYQQWSQARQGAKGDTPQEQMAILSELINAILLVQDAEEKKFTKRPEVMELLNLLRTRAVAEMSVANYVQQHQISDDGLKKAYDARYGSNQQLEFKARHILLDSEDDAKAIIKELNSGADFTALAKAKSTGPSASQGGELGWFDPTQMVKPFADAVVAMKNGAHSTSPIKTQFGWHVIFREDARETTPPLFEEVRDTIMNEKRRELVMLFISDLRKRANIQIRPPIQQPENTHKTTGEPAH